MKVTHTPDTVKAIAKSLLHPQKHGSRTPADVVRMLVDMTRKTLFDLAKAMKIYRGSTTTRSELIRLISVKYTRLYSAAVFHF